MFALERTSEGPFRGGATGHVELQGGELLLPLRGGLLNFCGRQCAQRGTVIVKLYDFYGFGAGGRFNAISKSGGTEPLYARKHPVTA